MKKIKKRLLSLFLLFVLPVLSLVGENKEQTTAIQGYDVVSYHLDEGKPQKGNRRYVAYYDNVAYLFANTGNKKAFEVNPKKYIPIYDGYCAYGMAYGSKIVSNPLVYTVVDGKLYLNVSKGVQRRWLKDVPGYIVKADKAWQRFKTK